MMSRNRLAGLSCLKFIAPMALLALWTSIASAAAITAGQLVNIRIGDGATTATAFGLPVTLDVYNVTYTAGAPTSVALAQSIPLPTSTIGTPPTSGNRYLIQGGSAGAEGGLTLSSDGKFMALAGYNNIVGAPTTSPGATNNSERVVGILNLSTGTVDTTTDFVSSSTSSRIANAFTTDGTNIWAATGSEGIRYMTVGSNSTTGLTGTANERRVYIYGGQLYTSRQVTSAGGISGVATVGSPPPPTSGTQTVTELSGMPVASPLESAYDYFFADANTLYVADDSPSPAAAGGLQKWTFNGSTWTRAYNLQVSPAGTAKQIRSLTGMVDGNGKVTLFGATADTTGSANYLYGFSDTIANVSAANVIVNKLIDASTAFDPDPNDGVPSIRWNLRGVALALPLPEPTSAVLLMFGFWASSCIARRKRS